MSLNESYAPPGLTPDDLWLETTMMVGPILGAIAYGALIALYILCLSTFFNPGAVKARRAFNMFYTSMLFAIGTIGNSANLRVMQISYIDNRNFPGGPVAFQIVYFTVPIQVAGMTFFTVGTWMQDAYLLYRFLVFWNFNMWLAILPVIMFGGVVASGIGFLYNSLHPGASIIAPMSVQFGTAFFSISVGLNLILTSMIIGRLVYLRTSIRSALGRQHAATYTSIVAMLVESSALYSTFALVFIITFALGDPVQNIVLPPLGVVQCIAPILIIYRVARGQAWTRETYQQTRNLSGMNFTPKHGRSGQSGTAYTLDTLHSDGKSANTISMDTESRLAKSVPSRVDVMMTTDVHRHV